MKPKIKTRDNEKSAVTYPLFYNENDDIKQTIKTEIPTENDEKCSIGYFPFDNQEAEVKPMIESEIKIENDEGTTNLNINLCYAEQILL